jgi:hypothetical protein
MTGRNIFIIILIVLILGGAGYWVLKSQQTPASVTATTTPAAPASTAGKYIDAAFGFSFTYDPSLTVTELAASSTTDFPGATEVKMIQVGAAGDATVIELTSANQTITDEPDNHASPIAQTKLFYDSAMKAWMIAYPEGRNGAGSDATTSATATGTTTGGLPIFGVGRRFDTRIIPLSPTKFVVVTSGGGASTDAIAESVTPVAQ